MSTIHLASTTDLYRHEVSVRQFSLTADEPTDLGGSDAGPTPTELVFAGLGACKAITLKMYAARKQWPLEAVEADIETQQINRRYQIMVKLKLVGDLSAEQIERLLEISNKCPVHKLLAESTDIETVLVS